MSGETQPEVMPPGTPHRISPEISNHEPPMHIPRPSSDRAQDVSHILASIFKDLYTKDVISKDTVENLTNSSEGSTAFHRKCMKELAKVHSDHQLKLQEYDSVERHIMQARARSTSADERAMNRVAGDVGSGRYQELGLPPVKSHFRWCLEEQKLKAYKLIVPSDLFTEERSLQDRPKKSKEPRFGVPTISSSLHSTKEKVYDGYEDTADLKATKILFETDEKSVTTLSSDSAELTSVPPRSPIVRKVNVHSVKNHWRENMDQDTRVVDRTLLARIEERHNFLRNPRHLRLSEPRASRLLTKLQPKMMVLKAGREVVQEDASPDDIQLFAPVPATVRFTEWTVGRVYETLLEVRNISTVSRKLRVLPPKTPFFSLGLGKYPGEDGFVAPGMSAHYNIRFMPDSLAEFEDEVEILSQAGSPLIVKIEAKRIPPVLTMSDKVDCGYCLVGGVNVTVLTLKNLGGNGRFCILKKSSWPAANFKTVVNPSCLDLGVFQIRPAVFEVLAGQSANLELVFAPLETEKYSEELVIVCDNCQVKYFTINGEGQTAAVELVSISDGGEEEPDVGEIADLTADHFIRFPPLNPHSFFLRQMIVHNSTNVELPYSWHILTPNLSPALEVLSSEKDNSWGKIDFYPDESSPFYIEPRSGVLLPNGIHEFMTTFAPQQVGEYRNVFHLVLSNVPEPKRDAGSAKSSAGKEVSCANAARLDRSESLDESAPRASRSSSAALRNTRPGRAPPFREVIALEVEVRGQSVPYSVVVHPPAIVIPGSVLVGATMKRPLRMANYSMAPVEFQWSNEVLPNIVQVEPSIGLINPGDFAELEVEVTGSKPGPLSCTLKCKIEHQEEPLHLSVEANIDGPHVVIDNVQLNFGLIKLGTTVSEKLFIRNTTQLSASWKLSLSEDKSDLSLSPAKGELAPLGQQEVTVTFRPSTPCSMMTALNLIVEGGKSSSVAVKGEVQRQQACFAECTLVLKDTFLSVPKKTTATLINQTLFPTKFRFGKLVGAQAKACDVIVHPEKGLLGPREEREIEVTFTGHVTGEINTAFLPCQIKGAERPIILSVFAIVQSLAVDFVTPGTEGSELKIEFGGSIDVGSTATSKLVITNLSAIRAPWTAQVESFTAHVPAPRQPALDFKSYRTRRAMLGRTPNLADPLAKTANQALLEHARLMLKDKQGAAFVVEPARGTLGPYQSQEISVTVYCDMWGEYKDVLSCQVEGLELKRIPVELTVVGCPLAFQLARRRDTPTTARFGTHLEGGPSVSRILRINNSSSFDIRLDWRTYNYPEPHDRKVIDLNVWFGEPFPLKSTAAGILKSTRRSMAAVVDTTDDDAYMSSQLSVCQKPRAKASVAESLPKLVNVRIEPHLGKLSQRYPFHVQPRQVVAPAHGHVTVTGIFQPRMSMSDGCVMGRECVGYSLGFMTLDASHVRLQEGKVTRIDGYEKQPLRLEMASFVQSGVLHIETVDDEPATSFRASLSDILPQATRSENRRALRDGRGQTYVENCLVQPLALTNNTATSLGFSLSVNEPFFIKSDASVSYHLPRNILKPQSNMKIHVGFRFDGVTLAKIENSLASGARKKEEDVVFKDDLAILYSNGVTQHHPLCGAIACPYFEVSETLVDFEMCFVGQEHSREILIKNPSKSDTWWEVTKEGTGLFRIEPEYGNLEAFESHTARNKSSLTVFFTARDDSTSEAVFTFRGLLGEPECQLKVTASGSFDGKFELK